MIYFICIIHLHIFHGNIWTQNWPAPNVSGFIAQLVRASHRYREVTGSSPVEVLNFFQASLRNCKNCDHNRRKTTRSRVENQQQTRPTYDGGASFRFVNGRCHLENFSTGRESFLFKNRNSQPRIEPGPFACYGLSLTTMLPRWSTTDLENFKYIL